MSLVNRIITQIHKSTKKVKYNHKKRHEDLYSFEYSDIEHLTSYRVIGRSYKLKNSDNYGIKKFKFGKEKYKFQIYLDRSYVICIDDCKVLIYKDSETVNGKIIPMYNSYNIDNETYFNLCISESNTLSASDIEQIRKVLRRKLVNQRLFVYGTDFILSGTVPVKW